MTLVYLIVFILSLLFLIGYSFITKKINPVVALSMVIPPLLFCSMVGFAVDAHLAADTEYWGSYVTDACYEEKWDEYIDQTCYQTVSCGKDCTTQVPYDCSYVEDHPEKWYFTDSLGNTTHIDENKFNEIVNVFGNKTFKEMNRDYHKIDGDAYVTIYNGEKDKLVPVTTKQTYRNKLQSSKSIFKFKNVEKQDIIDYQLIDYPNPSSYGEMNNIFGNYNKDKQKEEKYLSYVNSVYGSLHKVRVFILIFKEQPIEAALMQESYWQGGNKNELIPVVGIDKNNKVKWGYVISWTEKEQYKIDLKREILNQKGKELNLDSLIHYMELTIPKNFERRDFRQFEYLSNEIPFSVTLIMIVVSVVYLVGVTIFFIVNEY